MATNSNEITDLTKKTTKLVRGIHSWIKFQRHQGVESLTIEGKQALADVSQDKNGDASLVLKADSDKVDTVSSKVPYLRVAHMLDGSDPFVEKTATINQDLTQFPLIGSELVTVTKEIDSLTIHDEKIKEKLNTKINTVTSNIPYLDVSLSITGEEPNQEKTVTISQDLTQFPLNDGELVTVARTLNSLTIQDGQIKDFVNNTVTTRENDIRDFIREVKTELTNKINEQGGTGTKIDYSHDIPYLRTVTYNGDPCAYFHLTDCLISESTLIYVHYTTQQRNYANAHQYISSHVVSDYVNNNILFGSPLYDGVRITLPEKVVNASFEVITLGHVSDSYMDKTNQPLALTSDTSIEPYTSQDEYFKKEVVNIIDEERPIYFLDDYFTFNDDNQFFVISNNDHGVGIDNIEIDFVHNSRVIDKLLVKSRDFVNKVYENEKMYIKLYKVGRVVDTGGNVIYSAEYYNPSEKGYLCLHVTLKQPIKEGEIYSIYIKYYSKNPLTEILEMLPIAGDGTRLTAESMTN